MEHAINRVQFLHILHVLSPVRPHNVFLNLTFTSIDFGAPFPATQRFVWVRDSGFCFLRMKHFFLLNACIRIIKQSGGQRPRFIEEPEPSVAMLVPSIRSGCTCGEEVMVM